jgi:small subunit ribosomal protein S14
MAKKSILIREIKRRVLINRYCSLRKNLNSQIKQYTTFENLSILLKKIQKLPRNSSKTRFHNRCWNSGRARGFYRYFGISRIILRDFALKGLLPGVTKSSW